jgi:membrane fusion protein, multidrug efflux system
MNPEEPRNQNDFREDGSFRERDGKASDLKERSGQAPKVEEAPEENGRRLRSENSLDKREALREDPSPRKPEISDDSSERNRNQTSDGEPGWFHRFFRGHPLRIMMALTAVAILATAGIYYWNYLSSYEWTDDAQIDGHINPISPRIEGTIIHVYVEDTYHVKKGDPLADIDPADYEVALDQARSNLAQAEAALNAATHEYGVALANLAQAEATNVKAQRDAERYRQLFEKSVIPRAQYEEQLRIGKVDDAAALSARANLGAAAIAIDQRKATAAAAKATLDQATLNLSYTRIAAPVAGVVGEKSAEVGARVQPGQELLAIVPLNDVWVTANFMETQLRNMARGQPATIHVDTTGHDYKGYVEGMPAASGEKFSLLPPENATGNYVKVVQRLPVRIRLYQGEDPHHWLRPGMSVEPTVWVRFAESRTQRR